MVRAATVTVLARGWHRRGDAEQAHSAGEMAGIPPAVPQDPDVSLSAHPGSGLCNVGVVLVPLLMTSGMRDHLRTDARRS